MPFEVGACGLGADDGMADIRLGIDAGVGEIGRAGPDRPGLAVGAGQHDELVVRDGEAVGDAVPGDVVEPECMDQWTALHDRPLAVLVDDRIVQQLDRHPPRPRRLQRLRIFGLGEFVDEEVQPLAGLGLVDEGGQRRGILDLAGRQIGEAVGKGLAGGGAAVEMDGVAVRAERFGPLAGDGDRHAVGVGQLLLGAAHRMHLVGVGAAGLGRVVAPVEFLDRMAPRADALALVGIGQVELLETAQPDFLAILMVGAPNREAEQAGTISLVAVHRDEDDVSAGNRAGLEAGRAGRCGHAHLRTLPYYDSDTIILFRLLDSYSTMSLATSTGHIAGVAGFSFRR